ncbi:MAG TPA: T9SS type A sorting domain-containing protein [Flavobacteriaceae bacterium]|nr:T9SS type A sorting domain-containing protein [Flavobacteriaceae bacterium]
MRQLFPPKKKIQNKQKRKGFYLLALIFLSFSGLQAQRTLNVSGGSATISGDVYAYSIGEMVLVNTVTKPNLIVTHGLLQSNVDELKTEEVNLLTEGLELYPNPVDHILFLQPSLPDGGKLSVELYDLLGRIVMQRETRLDSGIEKQQLDLSALQTGVYLLKASLEQNGKVHNRSFKIIKRNTY